MSAHGPVNLQVQKMRKARVWAEAEYVRGVLLSHLVEN